MACWPHHEGPAGNSQALLLETAERAAGNSRACERRETECVPGCQSRRQVPPMSVQTNTCTAAHGSVINSPARISSPRGVAGTKLIGLHCFARAMRPIKHTEQSLTGLMNKILDLP